MMTPNTRRTRVALAACATGALALMSLSTTAIAAPVQSSSHSIDSGSGQKLSLTSNGAVQSLTTGKEKPSLSADAVSKELAVTFKASPQSNFSKVRGDKLGKGSLNRFQQVIDGHVVQGSSVATSLDGSGKLLETMGNVATGTKGTFPGKLALDRHAKDAKASATKSVKAGAKATAAVKDTVWFAPAVAGTATQGTVAEPAYRVSVSTPSKSWVVTVSALDTSKVLATATSQHEINRVICDANRAKATVTADLKCGSTSANKPSRVEGGAASSIADVNNVYNFFADTDAFYQKNTKAGDLTAMVGANYNDGAGKAMRASVRQCISGEDCPYLNAFWDDGLSAMVYGEGVTTDDITGHELTHGVTSKTNGLVYENEAGAINESMSDIFGEFMDVGNGNSDDTATNRWKMGEGSSLGVIRDMKAPKAHQQPDTYKGTYWVPTTKNPTDSNDYGGVHSNSGVGNKLASLLVDGGSHNAVTVKGIGVAKSSQIFWTTQTLLTSNATYSTMGKALTQACSTNASNAVAGITTADCTQVTNAIKAVKIP